MRQVFRGELYSANCKVKQAVRRIKSLLLKI